MLCPRDPSDQEYFARLNALAHSRLGDIPQNLITPEQVRGVLAGEDVEPTPAQRAAALRIGAEVRAAPTKKWGWRYRPLAPRLLRTRGPAGPAVASALGDL